MSKYLFFVNFNHTGNLQLSRTMQIYQLNLTAQVFVYWSKMMLCLNQNYDYYRAKKTIMKCCAHNMRLKLTLSRKFIRIAVHCHCSIK